MGHSYMETGWLRGWRIVRIVIRLRLRRGDYVPVCPAGLQYLAFPSLGVRPRPRQPPRPLCHHRFPPLALPLRHRSLHPSPPFTSFSRRCRCGSRKRREGNSRWLPLVRSRQNLGLSEKREARGGKKLHPFESHPRTPSGLKKSIKRREARRTEGDSWAKEGGRG